MAIIECVPNFSEGKDPGKVEKIAASAAAVPGVKVVDVNADRDHHRSVLTFIGTPDKIVEAAMAAAQTAIELIDIKLHVGVHPRVGAVDVVPFVPLAGATMSEAVNCAREFGQKLATKFDLPVFLYGEAARSELHRELSRLRQGGLEGLSRRLARGEMVPDFGPRTLNERSGATVVGARLPLIAYNVNLDSGDVELARRIAKCVRERDGGLPGVKALGLYLPSRGIAQVSMNITDYRLSPLLEVFRRVEEEAAKAGVKILSSELIGLAPAEALSPEIARQIHLRSFSPRMIIEHHLL
ncbi:MAG TPA: glutamate formimidoyltransferase [Syntrophales bacterium]|nr:glutamate formimidoyltransferase [Syntrophales bacterium]HOL59557.1 glutamate formimidoyltransferase [Syntrophales bacterium]HPO35647.1 glutamate formimidoyltransferase [Syntrophales bacterium]